MSAMNLKEELQTYEAQVYPNLEQTMFCSAAELYKKKKAFLADLRQSFKLLGFLVLVNIYLCDLSFTKLLIRAYIQYCSSNPYPQVPWGLPISDENKRSLRKFLLKQLLLGNLVCFCLHLFFDRYPKENSINGYSHGSLTLQLIGEKLVYHKSLILFWDIIVCLFQLVYFCLMCTVDDSKILEVKMPNVVDLENESIVESEQMSFEHDNMLGSSMCLIAIDVLGSIYRINDDEDF